MLLPDSAIETAVRAAHTLSNASSAPFHKIYAPELARAYYTAAIFEGMLARRGQLQDRLEIVPELNEFHFGEWQGKLIGEELLDDATHQFWQRAPLTASETGALPSCEGFVDFLQHMNHALMHIDSELPSDPTVRSIVLTRGMSWRAMGYLRYLREMSVTRLTAEQIAPHEYRFFNTAAGRFNTLNYAGG